MKAHIQRNAIDSEILDTQVVTNETDYLNF